MSAFPLLQINSRHQWQVALLFSKVCLIQRDPVSRLLGKQHKVIKLSSPNISEGYQNQVQPKMLTRYAVYSTSCRRHGSRWIIWIVDPHSWLFRITIWHLKWLDLQLLCLSHIDYLKGKKTNVSICATAT